MADEQIDLFAYHTKIPAIMQEDLNVISVKDRQYGASWMKRGGTGAFFVFSRMWDRLETLCEQQGYDIFAAIRLDVPGREGTLNAVQDLRRYLALVEATCIQRGYILPNVGQGWSPVLATPEQLSAKIPVRAGDTIVLDTPENRESLTRGDTDQGQDECRSIAPAIVGNALCWRTPGHEGPCSDGRISWTKPSTTATLIGKEPKHSAFSMSAETPPPWMMKDVQHTPKPTLPIGSDDPHDQGGDAGTYNPAPRS